MVVLISQDKFLTLCDDVSAWRPNEDDKSSASSGEQKCGNTNGEDKNHTVLAQKQHSDEVDTEDDLSLCTSKADCSNPTNTAQNEDPGSAANKTQLLGHGEVKIALAINGEGQKAEKSAGKDESIPLSLTRALVAALNIKDAIELLKVSFVKTVK